MKDLKFIEKKEKERNRGRKNKKNRGRKNKKKKSNYSKREEERRANKEDNGRKPVKEKEEQQQQQQQQQHTFLLMHFNWNSFAVVFNANFTALPINIYFNIFHRIITHLVVSSID